MIEGVTIVLNHLFGAVGWPSTTETVPSLEGNNENDGFATTKALTKAGWGTSWLGPVILLSMDDFCRSWESSPSFSSLAAVPEVHKLLSPLLSLFSFILGDYWTERLPSHNEARVHWNYLRASVNKQQNKRQRAGWGWRVSDRHRAAAPLWSRARRAGAGGCSSSACLLQLN